MAERSQAFELVLVTCWKGVYKLFRRRWGKPTEEARVLTLGFFSRMMEPGFFDRYNPEAKRFRTFLLEQVDVLASSTSRGAPRVESVALDFDAAEEELAHDPAVSQQNAEELFDSEWTRSLFTLAIEQLHNSLESQGKLAHFRLFQRFDLQDRSGGTEVTLQQAAQEFSLSLSDAALYLNDTRQSLRTIVIDLLRSFTSSEEELRREARSLFGM